MKRIDKGGGIVAQNECSAVSELGLEHEDTAAEIAVGGQCGDIHAPGERVKNSLHELCYIHAAGHPLADELCTEQIILAILLELG